MALPSTQCAPVHGCRQGRFHSAKAKFEQDYIVTTFSSFDEDGSGTIDRDEFAKLCWRVLGSMSPEDVQSQLQKIDANGDGEISLDEFRAWW
eukprot:SAG31_NODE_8147_length_1511_cov_1.215297_2_plen_92_part_00